MVKCLTSMLVAAALLFGAICGELLCVRREIAQFQTQVHALYEKTQAEQATDADAEGVVRAWEHRKCCLHIWIPHNDINRIDEHLAEGAGLIREQQFPFALAKLEVLLRLLDRLPGTYLPTMENIL